MRLGLRRAGSFHVLLIAGAAAASFPVAASAAEWVALVGGRLRVRPPYEGADHYVVSPYPTLMIRRSDRPQRFVPPDGGGTFGLIDTKHVVAGPALRFRYRRSDRAEFAGLDRIGVATEPGVFVDVWPKPWLRGRVEVRRGFGGHEGWVGDLAADVIYSKGPWNASIGPRVGFGDSEYMFTYFGVTPQQAAASPVINRAYDPGGGLRYTGLTVSVARQFSRRISGTADLGYTNLARRADDSPIVRRLGSQGQVSFGVGVTYLLGKIL